MACQSESKPDRRLPAAWALIAWLALSLAIAAALYIFRAHGLHWYAGLIKPPLNPPRRLWSPIWLAVCLAMGVAAWLVWKTRPSSCRTKGLRLFWVQLWFNLLWGWIFFSRHQIGTACVDLIVLWVAILLTILNFRKVSVVAAWLMVPCLAWVTFASYLNLAFWRLN